MEFFCEMTGISGCSKAASTRQLTLLTLVVSASILWVSHVEAAYWSVRASFGSADDVNFCEFEIPIKAYLQSATEFSTLPWFCPYRISVRGALEPKDAEVISEIIDFLRANPGVKVPYEFQLDSPGGSVSAAISIAQTLRTEGSPLYGKGVSVFQKDRCYSSCVLILAAGFFRNTYGEIGIHRPLFYGDEYISMRYSSLKEAYKGVYDYFRKFFDEVNIHPALVDDMWQVPSDELRVLRDSDLAFYGLGKGDAIRTESELIKLRSVCGNDGPRMQKEFYRRLDEVCADSSGKVEGSCYCYVYKSHPWKDCVEKLYGKRSCY